ncbi:hypothetical protein CK203_050335 [Vitis vinifera]|uniref:DUF4283 domain-containing protein n=1 Tax=Vitis vinifera TaxID=29760 RepID=A0A438GZQ5_VITVI|nr:hypothetical protein CK203_050335 [Vitis vinifera]
MGANKECDVFNVDGPLLEYSEKGRQCREERTFHKHVGPSYQSFANVVREEGPRKGGLVPVGRWARAVVCECHANFVNWAEGGLTILLRMWSPKENSKVVGKFKRGWIELWGLPFHLWNGEFSSFDRGVRWGMGVHNFQLQWLEWKTLDEAEKWVSQLGRSMSLTRGQVAEEG